MASRSEQQMETLRKHLRADPGIVGRLPDREGRIVQDALEGHSVYEIAQAHQMTEQAVWQVLASTARSASGQAAEAVEQGGLGSDTDPGVTGGYGDTGFGSLGNEPPLPVPEEPATPPRPDEETRRASTSDAERANSEEQRP